MSKVIMTRTMTRLVEDDDFQEAKESANGATDPQKAPLIVPGGAIDGKLYPKLFQDKFTDTATPRSLLHWDVELKEDERLAFSYIVPPKQGIQRMDSALQIIPFIIDQEGHNCVAQKSTDQEDNTNFAAPFTGYISSPRVGGQDQECKPGKYKVSGTTTVVPARAGGTGNFSNSPSSGAATAVTSR